MRLVYVDEAGISSKRQEPFLVVAAVIVHADQKLIAIERHLARLVGKHRIPEEHREHFVFHATEIFNGGGKVFKRPNPPDDPNAEWPLHRRLEIASDLAAIPGKFDLPVAYGLIKREEVQVPDGMKPDKFTAMCQASAFMMSAVCVDLWMRKHTPTNECCMMIVEDNDSARSTIRELQRDSRSAQQVAKDYLETDGLLPLKRVKHDPLFEEKRPLSALQIADFCAYVIKRVAMYESLHPGDFNDPLYGQFFRPFRKLIVDADALRPWRRDDQNQYRPRQPRVRVRFR